MDTRTIKPNRCYHITKTDPLDRPTFPHEVKDPFVMRDCRHCIVRVLFHAILEQKERMIKFYTIGGFVAKYEPYFGHMTTVELIGGKTNYFILRGTEIDTMILTDQYLIEFVCHMIAVKNDSKNPLQCHGHQKGFLDAWGPGRMAIPSIDWTPHQFILWAVIKRNDKWIEIGGSEKGQVHYENEISDGGSKFFTIRYCRGSFLGIKRPEEKSFSDLGSDDRSVLCGIVPNCK
jgi:hypothetical protein